MLTAFLFLLEILIVAFLLVVAAKVTDGILPKYFQKLVRLAVLGGFIGYVLASAVTRDFRQPPPPKTAATLLEQARGNQFYWNAHGQPGLTVWSRDPHQKKSCQIYALKQLGKLDSEGGSTVDDLIELFKQLEDFHSVEHYPHDDVYPLQGAAARGLGTLGHPDAIEPLVEMLVKKSLAPDSKDKNAIRWHDKEYEIDVFDDHGRVKSDVKRGSGPQGIVMGLMLMPFKHHAEISEKLKTAQSKIKQSEHFNDWSKFEIERAIRFFESDHQTRARALTYIKYGSHLDANFEIFLDPNYVAPPVSVRRISSDHNTGQR